jgi:hypothetical protein
MGQKANTWLTTVQASVAVRGDEIRIGLFHYHQIGCNTFYCAWPCFDPIPLGFLPLIAFNNLKLIYTGL